MAEYDVNFLCLSLERILTKTQAKFVQQTAELIQYMSGGIGIQWLGSLDTCAIMNVGAGSAVQLLPPKMYFAFANIMQTPSFTVITAHMPEAAHKSYLAPTYPPKSRNSDQLFSCIRAYGICKIQHLLNLSPGDGLLQCIAMLR